MQLFFLQIGPAISMIIGPETTCRDKGHFILKNYKMRHRPFSKLFMFEGHPGPA